MPLRRTTADHRPARATHRSLASLSPLAQLRAGRLPRRLLQLYAGLTLYGVSMAMMIRSGLGLDPWDVFHYGVARHVDLSFGTIVIVVGALVLLLWVPLRQWPGLGTVSNVFVIGLATDVALALLSTPDGLWTRVFLLGAGIVLNGLAGAMYIGSQFGAGPRDGLMTGLVRRTGLSVRLVRTSLELAVLVIGWLLGGVVGVGTVLYAVLIGPIVHVLLPRLTVDLEEPEPAPHPAAAGAPAPVQSGSAPGSALSAATS
jgi:uncharacterized membrane protein YczE